MALLGNIFATLTLRSISVITSQCTSRHCACCYTPQQAWQAKSTAGLGIRHTSTLHQDKGCYDIPSFYSKLDHSLSCLLAFYRCTILCARLSVRYATISVYSQYDPYSECRKHLQATDQASFCYKQTSLLCASCTPPTCPSTEVAARHERFIALAKGPLQSQTSCQMFTT